ncbi:leucine-rich repeat-containing protein 43-like isoform X2 [Amphiura filiformis]|uniref:leucine-rich repeat-containing protein 43-like isoform X2 n=1 Tax=Amphiura filiformis TaxID=82378 RepID=UPI003B20F1E0
MMMPVASRTDAFTAFQSQLRTLCLNEFPCGSGSWRTSTEKNVSDTRFTVTLKDYGANKEQEEALEEFVTSKFSPYSVDYSWSDEAKGLREIAVKSPWLITEDFIHNHFKTLRIVDKNVHHLDTGLLKLPYLEELTVTANHLTTVHSQNIPKTVKVLELVANKIDDLEQLCEDPPPELQHLGLGLNNISALHDYITGAYWPCLLSLDLSHNNLCDLIEIINKLSSLPKLRNLVLLGNPLALIPGYRGFTIDSLRKLDILDDLMISADEKHHFKGLARRKEYVLDEAKMTVKISAATGIPPPPEMLSTEEAPLYPVTTRTYYVEFKFLEDFQSKTRAESDNKKEQEKDKDQEKDAVANGNPAGGDDGGDKESPVTITDPTLTPSHTPPPTLKLVPYRTKGIHWTEAGFQFQYSQDIVIDDLPALKEYFKKGMELSIKEDKILSRPAETEESTEEPKGGKDGKGKDKPPPPTGDKKKKKKEPEVELVHSPPEVYVLGTYTLELAEFIEGEYMIDETCTCKGQEGTTTGEEEALKEEDDGTDSKKDKKKKKERSDSPKGKKGKGDGKESKEGKDKGKKPASKPDKKESKAKRPGSGKSQHSDEEEEKPPPPPLTVSISVELHHWKTAQESIPSQTVMEKMALLEETIHE